jgi:hypothetical protein
MVGVWMAPVGAQVMIAGEELLRAMRPSQYEFSIIERTVREYVLIPERGTTAS